MAGRAAISRRNPENDFDLLKSASETARHIWRSLENHQDREPSWRMLPLPCPGNWLFFRSFTFSPLFNWEQDPG
eukprot:m.41977 g.41977  ORF g.41977 m.41977 type:complete len:74 (+) comp33317_c0_seq2:304-525(+)